MNLTDLKIYALNAVALFFNYMQVDQFFKIVLAVIAIGYTSHKWYIMYREYNLKKEIREYENQFKNKKDD